MQDGGLNPSDQQPGQHPPGWYPDGSGMQRWWDGTQWTESQAPMQMVVPSSTSDPKTIAALTHVSALFLGFIGPLVAYLVYPTDPFIREHARTALNFQITLVIGILVSIPLAFILIGFVLMFGLMIALYVFEIMAAIAASKGKQYTYPFNIQFIKN